MKELVNIVDFDIGTPLHVYRMMMRPITLGALPKEGLVAADGKCGLDHVLNHHYWGTVEYTRKLSNEELERYGMEEI